MITRTPQDNRISYGCINVPVAFYETVVAPTFRNSNGIVYILPETRSVEGMLLARDRERPAGSPPGPVPSAQAPPPGD